MKIEVGKVYMKKDNFLPTIKKVLKIEDGFVTFQALYGTKAFLRNPIRKQRLSTFVRKPGKEFQSKLKEIPEEADPKDYEKYAGSIIWKNYTVLKTTGEPMMKCFERKALHWLKKGYAKRINEDTVQFTVTFIEDKLAAYHDFDNPFWMLEKNKQCAVCGNQRILTSHHIVPERHLDKIPLHIRQNLSNRLFICIDCHNKYEKNFWIKGLGGDPIEPDFDLADPRNWERHFIEAMNPQYMPEGWSVILTKYPPSELENVS